MFAQRHTMIGLFGALFLTVAMAQTELYEGSNKFAMELYQKVKGADSSNLVCSPISLQIALAMTYAGAGGNTAKQMKDVMHFPESLESTLEGHNALINALQDPVLKIASKLYVDNEFQLKEAYKTDVVKYFCSEVENVPFAANPTECASKINQWVEDKTNNKIKDLVSSDDLDPRTKLVLVNAIHFKAKWLREFKKERTFDADFHMTKERTTKVKMMHQTGEFNYGVIPELKASVLEMPYAGNKFKMVIILPDEIDGLKDVEGRLANMNLPDILGQLHNSQVEVSIPRFKIEKKIDLGSTLQSMGMTDLFTIANLSGIADAPLVVSKVIQKAFIEVNEEGTEAAAATGIQDMTKSIKPVVPTFRVNRGFLYFIRRGETVIAFGFATDLK